MWLTLNKILLFFSFFDLWKIFSNVFSFLLCVYFFDFDSNLMKYGWICASWGERERVKHSKTYIRIYWLCRGLINHVLKDETHVNRKLLKGFTTKFIENYLIIYQVSTNLYRCGTKWDIFKKVSKYSPYLKFSLLEY